MSMPCLPDVFAYRSFRASLIAGLHAAVVLSAISSTVMAQTMPQPAPQVSEPATPVKPPESTGLFGEIGKLLTAPAALLPSLKPADPTPIPAPPPASTAPPAAPVAPPAPAETSVNSPGSRLVPGIVSGRELCPRTEGGGPDCKIGSDRLCRSHGYTEGKSLSTDSVFGCSKKPLQTGGKPCGTQNYVTRAFCQ